MTIDITFYKENTDPESEAAIELSEDLYKNLADHKNLIGWVIEQLEAEGIKCQRTTGNDSRGDILYFNPEDEPKVKEIVQKINKNHNS